MKKGLILLIAFLMVCMAFAGCTMPASDGAEPAADDQPAAEEPQNEDTAEAPADAPADSEKPLVAFLMPTKEQPIWAAYGTRLVEAFENAGYLTSLEYAEDSTERQVSQVENALLKGAKYIILASVDSYAVSDVTEKAKADGATIIACDRLIMNTEAVDYYLTFDLVRMGEIQGEYIESALGLADGKGPFNLEIFSGSPDDANSIPFYEGAMSVLQKYIDSGKLVVRSGQTSLDVTGTLKWDSATAQSRMDNILSSYYSSGEKVDAVLAAADCLALGIISSLDSMGYGQSADMPFPVVVGQDCEITAIKSILAGKQSMSVFLDPVVMSGKMVELVGALAAGGKPETQTTYNNDMIDVPTVLYDPVLVTKDNYDILIDRGFYTEEDLA